MSVFGSVEILLLFILLEGDEGDPLSPQEGAAQGEHPLDPFSLFLPSLKRISHQLHEGHRIFMNASTGAEEKGYRSSKKCQNNFSMISKKPFF